MGKAAKVQANIERKVAERKVKGDMAIFVEQAIEEEINKLNEDEYYKIEDDDGNPLFKGNYIKGELLKFMYNDSKDIQST